MIADCKNRNEYGIPNKDKIGRSSHESLICFVCRYIEVFVQKKSRMSDSEDKISRDLIVFLNQKSRTEETIFQFVSQDLEEESTGVVDIGIYSSSSQGAFFDAIYYSDDKRYFCFEAKILGVNDNQRIKEYVIGHRKNGKYIPCGGIERYKRCIHGAELTNAALIGYMKRDNYDFWFRKINQWILELSEESEFWSDRELLQSYNMPQDLSFARYFSTHKREDKEGISRPDINLNHIWMKIE
jgi:hypothetical protein